MNITYNVLAFRQQAKSPIQVAFVAFAGDLSKWSGIPRKSDEFMTGYQRFKDIERVNRSIVPFFQDPRNCSPTAVIVALRSEGKVGGCTLMPSEVPVGQVVEAKLTIQLDEDAIQTDAVFEEALEYITARLAQDQSGGSDSIESTDEDDDLDQTEDEDAEAEDTEGNSVHLGSETLGKLKEYLEDKENWKNPDFRSAIVDFVKPAMLIDGQHRVAAGAKFGERGLPFMVCGLFGAGWEEQVFQFTVVNLKPKKIPPSLITSIAALSLSRTEQQELRSRLNQAGVKMTEVEIMSLVSYDEASPFYGLIDMGVGAKSSKTELLGYASVKRIAKEWFTCRRPSLLHIARSLFGTDNIGKAAHEWRVSKLWFEFFCFFWDTVRAHYPDNLWKKWDGNKLFVGATLWGLQEALLIECDGAMKSHWKVEQSLSREEKFEKLKMAFAEIIETYLAYLPAEMWTVPWTKSSIDTNQGREEFRKVLTYIITEGKKEEKAWKGWKKHEWFETP